MKRYFHIALLVASITLAAQITVSPLIHNHPLDFKDHFDCPAYVISTTLLSFLLILFVGINLKSPFLRKIVTPYKSESVSEKTFSRIRNKAPPLFSV